MTSGCNNNRGGNPILIYTYPFSIFNSDIHNVLLVYRAIHAPVSPLFAHNVGALASKIQEEEDAKLGKTVSGKKPHHGHTEDARKQELTHQPTAPALVTVNTAARYKVSVEGSQNNDLF